MLQSNITGVCLQCLIHSGLAPAHGAHRSGSTYVAPPGNCLRPALGFMHLPGPSHSGSALRKPSEAQIWLGLRFVPFPGPSGSGVWRAPSLRLWPFRVAQFSGCTAGVPSQEDDDCPEPPEVLVNKEACLHFGR